MEINKRKLSLKRFVLKIFYFFVKIIAMIRINSDPEYPSQNYLLRKYKKKQLDDCLDYHKKNIEKSVMISKDFIREYSIKKALSLGSVESKLFLEFGVFKGTSINFFSNFLRENQIIHGFDTFTGLPEDWSGMGSIKGSMSLDGKLPKVKKNVKLIEGLIEDNLINFLNSNKEEIVFVHIDTDLATTQSFILKNIKNRLANGAILLFDDFYNIDSWFATVKSLEKEFSQDQFEYLAFAVNSTEVCLRFIKN